MTLTAHLTAGHTRGCTTWTMPVQDGGRTYNVVFACSLRAPGTISPAVAAEFNTHLPEVSRASLRRAPWRSSGAVQYDREAREARERRRQSVRRSRELHGRGRHPGSDVQGHACRAAERREIAAREQQEFAMCRNIRTLFNFEPPATEEEIRASALQFVRKLSGFTNPSRANRGRVSARGRRGFRSRAPSHRLARNREPCARSRSGSRESARTVESPLCLS